MTNNIDDPFELCHECRTLGHCKLRALRALANHAQAPARYKKPSPPPEPYTGPVYTLREFVAEHRPELTRLLPRVEDDKPDTITSSRPTLGQLQKIIAARKVATAPEAQVPVMEVTEVPVAVFQKPVVRKGKAVARFPKGLRKLPHHSMDKRILPPRPHSTILWSVDSRTSLTSFSSLEI